ncbi:unnamed protein product [Didymodactylos carnosus]|uniref:Cyclin N-terminal domain-containing protein n=1 Tax=Didymodactylos carnosus TaxID=1234261 RepID=A0A815Y3I3_9BILA|nr:unnamed protein product [Didymodactylos carnosus]CAF1565201.1 unnamed protein product [Didymodactylos carnosus]CAF3803152.1 unnamed protein product [Didymodactylos carnosus]CAF4427250.1 unnamed protein product [Didymodactylos carnosus]
MMFTDELRLFDQKIFSMYTNEDDEYVHANRDAKLCSDTDILQTMLAEEDELCYHDVLTSELPSITYQTMSQINALLNCSVSVCWMSNVVMKRYCLMKTLGEPDISLICACVTLCGKYQDSTEPKYEHLAMHCQTTVEQIHICEIHLLETLSWDLCVYTPSDYLSVLYNSLLADEDEVWCTMKNLLNVANNILLFLYQTEISLLSTYPNSILALSLLLILSLSSRDNEKVVVLKQMQMFLKHKKSPQQYKVGLKQVTSKDDACDI